jgi:hypothetical protein
VQVVSPALLELPLLLEDRRDAEHGEPGDAVIVVVVVAMAMACFRAVSGAGAVGRAG